MSSWDDALPAKPLWLITLADLSLLLVGFFVLLQANQRIEPRALADGIRSGFGAKPMSDSDAMAVDMAVVRDFAPGSAALPDAATALAWAQVAARDPRTRLKITGETNGTGADVDPATGSGAILAADRARAVASFLIRSGVIAPERIVIVTARGQRRVALTLGYDGGRQ